MAAETRIDKGNSTMSLLYYIRNRKRTLSSSHIPEFDERGKLSEETFTTRSQSRWVGTLAFRERQQQSPGATAAMYHSGSGGSIEQDLVAASSGPPSSASSTPPTQFSPLPQPYAYGLTEDRFGHFRRHSIGMAPLNRQTGLNMTVPLCDTTVLPAENARRNFQPSEMWYRNRGLSQQMPPTGDMRIESTRYQGDLNGKSYTSQIPNLPDHRNCSLWLTNIPRLVLPAEIFDIINCGAVFALHINSSGPNHPRTAAKLVFTKPESAAKFITIAKDGGGIWMYDSEIKIDVRVNVRYNRYGSERWDVENSRVLHIEGPADMMTFEYWDAFFRRYCQFDWDRVLPLPCTRINRKRMEFRFMRVDGQAQMCLRAIFDNLGDKGVNAEYGPDPCDVKSC